MGDIKALENSTYWEFCTILNNYLEKVEVTNKQIEELNRKNGNGNRAVKSGKGPRK